MALMPGLVMVACNKQGDLANQQQLLLKAPSGISIVANSDVLMKVALETVSETSGLEITKVDYLPVKTGFAAIVWYKTKAGAAGNFAYVRYPKIEYNAKKLVVKRGGVTSQLVKGDITVSSSGSVWTIDNNTVGVAKINASGNIDTSGNINPSGNINVFN